MGSSLGSGRGWIPQGDSRRSQRLVLFVISFDKKIGDQPYMGTYDTGGGEERVKKRASVLRSSVQ